MFEIKDFKSKKKENVIFFNFCQSQNVFNHLFLLWLKILNRKVHKEEREEVRTENELQSLLLFKTKKGYLIF